MIDSKAAGNTVGDGAENDRDGIQVDTSSNIWIDHCESNVSTDPSLTSNDQ
jgi:pectate lyase